MTVGLKYRNSQMSAQTLHSDIVRKQVETIKTKVREVKPWS